MREPVVIVGLGEMGGVFAHGFLRRGRPVVPVVRDADVHGIGREVSAPHLVVVAVGEADLGSVLGGLPPAWKSRAVLLQNELLPTDWEAQGVADPTVAVVWFEKKRTTPIRVIRPTVLAGPGAPAVADALAALDIPALTVAAGDALLHALVAKNLYILTTNLAGLEVGGTVGDLWAHHRPLAQEVAREVLALQGARVGRNLPGDALVADMAEAFAADPAHQCTGRSAPARLRRCLDQAEAHGVEVPRLRGLAKHIS
jgi:ketopantoate reductase